MANLVQALVDTSLPCKSGGTPPEVPPSPMPCRGLPGLTTPGQRPTRSQLAKASLAKSINLSPGCDRG
jgi:hypothetical protein